MKKIISIVTVIMFCFVGAVGCGTGTNSESLEKLIVLGAQYLVDGNYSEAVVAFDKAIKVDDKSVVAYVGLGDANLGLEDYGKAGDAYEKAITVDDQTIEAYIGRADAYLFEENTESAVAILNEGYEATGDAELSSIVEEINAGTYEPSILHMDWQRIATYYSGNLQELKDAWTNDDSDSKAYTIPAKVVKYGNGTTPRELYDADNNLIEVIGDEEYNVEDFEEKHIYYYDEEGYMINSEHYDSLGLWFTAKTQWSEDRTEMIYESWSRAGDNLEKDKDILKYNFYTDGSVKQMQCFSQDGQLTDSYEVPPGYQFWPYNYFAIYKEQNISWESLY